MNLKEYKELLHEATQGRMTYAQDYALSEYLYARIVAEADALKDTARFAPASSAPPQQAEGEMRVHLNNLNDLLYDVAIINRAWSDLQRGGRDSV